MIELQSYAKIKQSFCVFVRLGATVFLTFQHEYRFCASELDFEFQCLRGKSQAIYRRRDNQRIPESPAKVKRYGYWGFMVHAHYANQ